MDAGEIFNQRADAYRRNGYEGHAPVRLKSSVILRGRADTIRRQRRKDAGKTRTLSRRRCGKWRRQRKAWGRTDGIRMRRGDAHQLDAGAQRKRGEDLQKCFPTGEAKAEGNTGVLPRISTKHRRETGSKDCRASVVLSHRIACRRRVSRSFRPNVLAGP